MSRSSVTLFIHAGLKVEAHKSALDGAPVVTLDSDDTNLVLFFDTPAQVLQVALALTTFLEGVSKEEK